MSQGRVFYAVLDMGLGHATRSLPIIKEFADRKWEIWIGSCGRSLAFLKKELPVAQFIETPGYGISYSHGQFLLPKLISQIPKLLSRIRKEHRICRDVVEKFSPDLIISDHCYGMHHPRIRSYFLSHQVYFSLPSNFRLFAKFLSRFNFVYHRHYRKVLIPDVPENGHGLLSGELSRLPDSNPKYQLIGILSSIKKQPTGEDLDLLVSISGPEPQRTIFEKIVMEQIDRLPGKKVVVLGRSEESQIIVDRDDLKIYSHLPRYEVERSFSNAALIVSRPGYSTLMELAEIGKKALLVPTPGQTEQEYLAKLMLKRKWFHSVEQNRINLSTDIEIAKTYNGVAMPGSTQQTVAHLFDDVLKV